MSRAFSFGSLSLLLVLGCGYDTGKLAAIEPDLGELDPIEVCEGVTFRETRFADTIDEECRSRVEAVLPAPASGLRGRLIVLGTSIAEDGSQSIYLFGASPEGNALTSADWAQARAVVTAADGSVATLSAPDLGITPVLELPGEPLSLAFVNDHSASMREVDLEVVAEVEQELLARLPASAEATVVAFSTTIAVRQPFTSNRELLQAAFAPDPEFPRAASALYDAVGTTLQSLLDRPRAARLLVLATDGPDTASHLYTRTAIAELLAQQGAALLVLGALFADPAEARRMSAGVAAFSYAHSFQALAPELAEVLSALENMVELKLPSPQVTPTAVQVELGSLGVRVRARP